MIDNTMASTAGDQGRNDRHFFCFVGIVVGAAFGGILGLTLANGQLQSLQPWQTLIASLVALFAAFIAYYNVRAQINAGIEKDVAARAEDRLLRKEDADRKDQIYKDCGIILGQAVVAAFDHCQTAVTTRPGSGNPGDWLNTPINFQPYQEYRQQWDDIFRPLAHDACQGLTHAAKIMAITLLKMTDRAIELTDVYVAEMPTAYVPVMPPDYTKANEAFRIITQFRQVATSFEEGKSY